MRGSECINVPEDYRALPVTELPMSKRLDGLCQKLDIRRLGGFQGMSVNDLRTLGNCGKKTISELKSLVQRVAIGDFGTPDQHSVYRFSKLIEGLDFAVASLPGRERELILEVFGGRADQAPVSFIDLARQHGISRQRIHALYWSTMQDLPRYGGPVVVRGLQRMIEDCEEGAYTLTPELIEQEVKADNFTPDFPVSFYLRLLKALTIAGEAENPRSQTLKLPSSIQNAVIEAIVEYLKEKIHTEQEQTLQYVLFFLRRDPRFQGLSFWSFLFAILNSPQVCICWTDPKKPTVKLAKITVLEAANLVLGKSKVPLNPHDIARRIKPVVASGMDPRYIAERLRSASKFCMVGRSEFGLPHHVKLQRERWHSVRRAFEKAVMKNGPSLSVQDFLERVAPEWREHTNRYELTSILRADSKFEYLGRGSFALAT